MGKGPEVNRKARQIVSENAEMMRRKVGLKFRVEGAPTALYYHTVLFVLSFGENAT